jgi:hypothetical protein
MVIHRRYPKIAGFRLGIYVFKGAEIVDYAAPYGVFSMARRFDPELDAFLSRRHAPGADASWLHHAAELQLLRLTGHERLSHSERLRHTPGDA